MGNAGKNSSNRKKIQPSICTLHFGLKADKTSAGTKPFVRLLAPLTNRLTQPNYIFYFKKWAFLGSHLTGDVRPYEESDGMVKNVKRFFLVACSDSIRHYVGPSVRNPFTFQPFWPFVRSSITLFGSEKSFLRSLKPIFKGFSQKFQKIRKFLKVQKVKNMQS